MRASFSFLGPVVGLLLALLVGGCTERDFTVSLDQPLRVTAAEPGGGTQGARRQARVMVRFSEEVRAATLTDESFYLELLAGPGEEVESPQTSEALARIAGTISYDAITWTATFEPEALLDYSSWYRVVVTTEVERTRPPEATLPIDVRWAFKTLDPRPLALVAHFPSAGALDAARLEGDKAAPITLVFNQDVDPESVEGSLEVRHFDGSLVPGSAAVDARVLTFRPTSIWDYSAQYQVRIGAELQSDIGGALESEIVYVFDTVDPPPLRLIHALPSGGAVGVDRAQPLTFTFSEGVDQAAMEEALIVRDMDSGDPIPGTLTFGPVTRDAPDNSDLIGDDDTVVFRPNTPAGGDENPDLLWAYSASIQVELRGEARSDRATDGSANQSGHHGGWFTPLGLLFRVEDPPAAQNQLRILGTLPVDGAASVPVSSAIEASFSHDMLEDSVDPASNLGVVVVADVSNPASPREVQVSFIEVNHSTYTVRWELADPLAPIATGLKGNTPYRVRIRGGAEGARSTLGDSLLGDFTFEFVTAATDRIAGTRPYSGAADVEAKAEICAIFTSTVDPGSVDHSSFRVFFQDDFGRTVQLPVLEYRYFATDPATLERLEQDPAHGGADNEVCFVPDPDRFNCFTDLRTLLYQTTYTALLTTAFRTFDGALDADYAWSFETGLPPRIDAAWARNDVVLVEPLDGAMDVPVNATFSIEFEGSIDPATVGGGAIALLAAQTQTPVAASVVLESDGRTASLTATAPLDFETTYELKVEGGIGGPVDTEGNYLEAGARWSLTTSPPTEVKVIFPVGDTVRVNTLVVAELTRPIHPQSLSQATFLLGDQDRGIHITGLTSTRGDALAIAFIPSVILQGTTNYQATITGDLRDFRGNPIAAAVTQSFRTSSGTDVTPPNLLSSLPAQVGVLEAGHAPIMLDFDEQMNLTSLVSTADEDESTVHLERLGSLGEVVERIPARFQADSESPNRIWVHPERFLRHAGGASYRLRLDREVSDLGRNPLWTAERTFTVEGTPPMVTAVSPVDGGTQVPGDAVMRVELNERIDPATVNVASFLLFDVQGDVVVAGSTSVSEDGRSATFSPSAPLLAGHTYVITVSPPTAPITDTAGNPLPLFPSDFNVIEAPLQVMDFVPLHGETGVARATPIYVELDRAPAPETLIASTTGTDGTFRLFDESNSEEVFGCIEVDPEDPARVFFRAVGTSTVNLDILESATQYRLIVTTGMGDPAGNWVAAEQSALWTTE